MKVSMKEGGMKRFMTATLIVIVLIVFGGVVSVCRDNNGDDKDGDVIPDNAWDAPTQESS